MDDLSQRSTPSADQIAAAAAKLVADAQAACAPIEARLKYLADLHHGTMVGLEWKIKPVASLIRKMTQNVRNFSYSSSSPPPTIDPKLTPEQRADLEASNILAEVTAAQYDVLRFTMIMPPSNYTLGAEEVIETLPLEERCQCLSVKNYWGCWTYKGINTIFMTEGSDAGSSSSGAFEGDTGRQVSLAAVRARRQPSTPTSAPVKFEVQFHTPESFDNKQNQTHHLYEVLRKENDPVKQYLFFADMQAMWDAVHIPFGVLTIGSAKTQEYPAREKMSQQQQKLCDRVKVINQPIIDCISSIRQRLLEVDSRGLRACVEFAVTTAGERFPLTTGAIRLATLLGEVNHPLTIGHNHCGAWIMKDVDHRFRSSLKVRRRVEEQLRKKVNMRLADFLHEVDLPSTIDGLPMAEYLQSTVLSQSDLLRFVVVMDPPIAAVLSLIQQEVENACEEGGPLTPVSDADQLPTLLASSSMNHPSDALTEIQKTTLRAEVEAAKCRYTVEHYTDDVLEILASIAKNGYQLINVQNFWNDMEKHHAVRALFQATLRSGKESAAGGKAGGSAVKAALFSVEFHTAASFEIKLERNAAFDLLENNCYVRGEPVIKAALDMQVRYDQSLLRRWMQLSMPNNIQTIGIQCVDRSDTAGVEGSPNPPVTPKAGKFGLTGSDNVEAKPARWVPPFEMRNRIEQGWVAIGGGSTALLVGPALSSLVTAVAGLLQSRSLSAAGDYRCLLIQCVKLLLGLVIGRLTRDYVRRLSVGGPLYLKGAWI